MLDLQGLVLSHEEKELLQNPLVGGVILFSRNYDNISQLQKLTFNIRNCRKDPILIAVDHEGGRVQRFTKDFSILPAFKKYGEMYDRDPIRAFEFSNTMGWLMASELLSVSIDLSFAPVLDLNLGKSAVIGDRAFHADPECVIHLAEAFIAGMHEAGMAAIGKHFPGHGSVPEDSHTQIPIDNRDLPTIGTRDLLPFSRLIPFIDGFMPAHIIFPQVDSLPVGFSSTWIQEILRQDMLFNSVVISDDLSMMGASRVGDYPERAKTALAAGCDMIIICNNRQGVNAVLKELTSYQNKRSEQRLLKLCGYFKLTRNELENTQEWARAVNSLKEYQASANCIIVE